MASEHPFGIPRNLYTLPIHLNLINFWWDSCIGTVKNASFRSTLAIQAFGFIILKTANNDSILKCLYWTNSSRYFKSKTVLKVPSFFYLVNTMDTKSSAFLEHSTMTPLFKIFLTSWVIILVPNMSCEILGTFWCWGFSAKLILRPYWIIWSFVIFIQFS